MCFLRLDLNCHRLKLSDFNSHDVLLTNAFVDNIQINRNEICFFIFNYLVSIQNIIYLSLKKYHAR